MEYDKSQICKKRIKMLNDLCQETDSKVVVSSTWRSGRSVKRLQEIFDYCGGTFEVLDKTGNCKCRTRGCEIDKWLDDNTKKYFGVLSHDFYRYVIIDDDSDMLLNQQSHFFQTDNWSGLTPTTCYKIKCFLLHKTF